MRELGNNILIKPDVKSRVLPSGIMLTNVKSDKEWGVIVSGGEKLVDSYGLKAMNGMRVLYFSKAFEQDGIKLVPSKNCLTWKQAQE